MKLCCGSGVDFEVSDGDIVEGGIDGDPWEGLVCGDLSPPGGHGTTGVSQIEIECRLSGVPLVP